MEELLMAIIDGGIEIPEGGEKLPTEGIEGSLIIRKSPTEAEYWTETSEDIELTICLLTGAVRIRDIDEGERFVINDPDEVGFSQPEVSSREIQKRGVRIFVSMMRRL